MSIEMFRGDSRDQMFTCLYKTSRLPVDLRNAAVVFTVRRFEKDDFFTMQYKNEAAGGSNEEIDMTDPINGKFVVHMKPVDTEKALGGERYWYDVQLTINGKVTTAIKARILFNHDITR